MSHTSKSDEGTSVHTAKKRQDNFFIVCSNCKTCCCKGARPPITPQRRKTIEAHLKNQKIRIQNPFVQASYTFPKEDAEGYCIFYNKKTGKCLVHLVKPETCVAGPITFDINAESRKIEWHLKMEKICSLAGALYRNRDALKTHLKSAKKEILTLVSELNAEALRAILKIEEPETFKIGEDDIGKNILHKLAGIE
jgi:Fe-S-cluster containining protein